jgi:sortase (surface protein transpeptidase)
VRPAAAVAALGLALAVGTPAAWALTRPAEAVGAPVTEALGTTPASPPRGATPAVPAEAPAPGRLTIPDLGVDAPVHPVGVAADGQMEIPADVARVGWYRFGPVPGNPGNAVLAGHVDDAEQGLGALAALREVAVGTEVLVTDAAGVTSRWRVVSRQLIGKQALPTEDLFARTGPPRLVLVTCGGPFLAGTGHYRDNVVVVAEPVR